MNSHSLIYPTHTPHTPATHPRAKAQNVVQNRQAPPCQAQCMALTLVSKHAYNIITLSLLACCPLSLYPLSFLILSDLPPHLCYWICHLLINLFYLFISIHPCSFTQFEKYTWIICIRTSKSHEESSSSSFSTSLSHRLCSLAQKRAHLSFSCLALAAWSRHWLIFPWLGSGFRVWWWW
jgi:hypothetical protein